MPLEELMDTIERLKGRIGQHHQLLRQSEALTRYALIDPLLRVLGWDTEDPERVRPKYPDPNGRPDYALIQANQPVAMLEAKSVGTRLDDDIIRKVIGYCTDKGVKYAVLTDGNTWEAYDLSVFSPNRDERRMFSFSIGDDEPYQCALKALYLWQPNLESANSIVHPPSRTLAESLGSHDQQAHVHFSRPSAIPFQPSKDMGWISLAELKSVTRVPPPQFIQFLNGEEIQITRWWNVTFQVAEWQVKEGKLTLEVCPIKYGRTKYLVNSSPVHSNGTPFNQFRQLSNNLYLDTPYDAVGLRDAAKFLLEHFGDSPKTVWLRMK